MNRAELLETNTVLRSAVEEVSDLTELEFDAQASMDMNEIAQENKQLVEILSKARDAVDDAVGEEEDE